MRPNQDVKGDAKKCASDHAMATPLAYARVYPEPSFDQFFHFLGLRDIYFPEIRFVKGLKNLAFLPRADNSISLR